MKILAKATIVLMILFAALFSESDTIKASGSFSTHLINQTSGSSSVLVISTVRTSERINLRSGPSTSFSIISTLPVGTIVEILSNESNGWSRVMVGETSGFIRSDLLRDDSSSATAISAVRTTARINLRSGPSTSFSIISTLPVGTIVELLSNDANGWSRVTVGEASGFIRSDLLRGSSAATEQQGSVAETQSSAGRYPSISSADRDMLARLVRLEAPNECERGKQAVAEVVLNRMISQRWSHVTTIEEVIFDNRWAQQFTVSGMINTDRATPAAADLEAVDSALSGPYVLETGYYFFNSRPVTQNDVIWIGMHAFSK